MTISQPAQPRAPREEDSLRQQIRALESASASLEPDSGERARLRGAIVASGERFLDAIAAQKAFEDVSEPAKGLLDLPLGAEGTPLAEVLRLFEEEVLGPGGHPAAAGHLAYLSGGGLYHAALADYLGALSNKFAGIFFTGPGPVRMENLLLRWVTGLVGYPAGAGGAILSGGSLANLTAVTAARDARRLRAADYPRSVVYLSEQTHHSIHKALRIAGMAEAPIRRVPVDSRYRMNPTALAAVIAEDSHRGLRPWLVTATAGATDTGAVDPLAAIAEIAEQAGCWLHVDAAYGGFFLMTAHGRKLLRGIERSDSTVLDPHKSLFLPWGSGIVAVRDRSSLLAPGDENGHYLQDAKLAVEESSPADVSPELTKPFRALRMWLPLVLLGSGPFRAALEEKLLLARYFHREIARLGFWVGPSPDLSVVVFRWAPAGVSAEQADEINRDIAAAMRHDGRIFLSSTLLDGRFTLRMAALPHRCHLETIDLTLEILAGLVAARPEGSERGED